MIVDEGIKLPFIDNNAGFISVLADWLICRCLDDNDGCVMLASICHAM